jgi:two-component sensor histidine kinase
LSLYFLFNNNKINRLLVQKNEELSVQQELLWQENSIRRAAEEKAKESLIEREVLLSEIHHRVKNNLAVITGLMELQSVYIKDKNTLNVIKESQNRIKSLAILHEKLYENKTLKEVEMRSYIEQLLEFVKKSLASKEKNIRINTKIDPINLEMTKAMPFSLLLNELISNSYKHAFNSTNEGEIQISFSKNDSGYLLEFSDNGPGFDYEANKERKSLGLNLIETFSKQLLGKFGFSKQEPGMKFTLNFS